MNLTKDISPRIIRKARPDDVPRMMEIFSEARGIMRSDGNMHQWVGGYPSEELIRKDISEGVSYVVVNGDKTVGAFAFIIGTEPTYLYIEGGTWVDDTLPYATIHRLGSTRDSHGVAEDCFRWAWEQIRNIRIDTHRDNRIMQHCIGKAGFRYCGIIYLENGDERLAYQRI